MTANSDNQFYGVGLVPLSNLLITALVCLNKVIFHQTTEIVPFSNQLVHKLRSSLGEIQNWPLCTEATEKEKEVADLPRFGWW